MSQPREIAHPSQSESTSFRFDEYCDLLGGASWDDFFSRRISSENDPNKPRPTQWIKNRFTAPNQFLFSDLRSRICPLEVLWLKWNVFSDLCIALHAYHKDKKKPHLNLNPQGVQISLPEQVSASFPARWVFSLDLDRSKTSRRFPLKGMPNELQNHLFKPPEEEDVRYQAPVMRVHPLGHEVSGMVAVRSIEKIKTDETEAGENPHQNRGITEFHFVSKEIQEMVFSEKDLFLAKLYFYDDPDQAVDIWASKPENLEKGILLHGFTEAMDAERWEKFNRAKESIFPNATLNIYKSYQAPCDLYSLGMMLFHLLLVNDTQDIDQVHLEVQKISLRLAPMVQGLGPEDRWILVKRFKEIFDAPGSLFSKSAIFYSGSDQETTGQSISDDLWVELLIFSFRLVTFIPGFSTCSHHGDLMNPPELLMDKIIQDIAGFSEEIKERLFGSRQREIEIQEVCHILRKELLSGEANKNAV